MRVGMGASRSSAAIRGAPPKAAKRLSVTRQVVDALYGYLRSGKYRTGDRLPSEWQLVRDLRAGRSAVREAIRELVTLDLVEIRPGVGTFVKQLRPDLLLRGDSFGEQVNAAVRRELLEVRLIFEPAAAAIAAQRASDFDVARLRHDVDRLREAVHTGFRPPEDLGFHLDVVRSTHNPSLARVAGAIVSFYDRDVVLPTEADVSDHLAICEAIARHDSAAAREAMQRHLTTTLGAVSEPLDH
jgi:GntR family transcriptional repressor for pyruvate dehydrogenase complex